jgi:hypothetical protein
LRFHRPAALWKAIVEQHRQLVRYQRFAAPSHLQAPAIANQKRNRWQITD